MKKKATILLNKGLYKVNGYNIRYNNYWQTRKFQVMHLNIGYCGSFNKLSDAKEYCNNG